jgi:hypothetical protein
VTVFWWLLSALRQREDPLTRSQMRMSGPPAETAIVPDGWTMTLSTG